MTDYIKEQWTLFDKIMYGGLGWGQFCLPTDFFKVIIAIIFPPLGEVINIIEGTISDLFPYITWDTLKELFKYKSLNKILYSFLLTTLFYIPGLVYTLTNIVEKERKTNYEISPISEYTSPDGKQIIVTNVNDIVYVTEKSINGNIILYKKSVSKMSILENEALEKISTNGMIAVNELNQLNEININNINNIGNGISTTGENIKSGIESIGGLF